MIGFGGHLPKGVKVSDMRKKRRLFKPEFKEEIVKLVLEGRRSVVDVSREHDLVEASVYAWVRQAKVDAGKGRPDELTSAEKAELSELRKENRELKRERDFLAQAAAYFAETKRRKVRRDGEAREPICSALCAGR